MTASPLGNPDLEAYLVLAQEMMRRVYADESPEHLQSWLRAQLDRLIGAKDESARLLWEDSFRLYDEIMAKREAEALMPECDRRMLTWPWASWRQFLDPLEPGLLAVVAGSDGAGKCLARGTRIVMADGTLRAVEDIAIGDELMGPDSRPRRVRDLGRGRGMMYWIRQNSGIDYRANGDHILALLERDNKGNKATTEKTVEEVLLRPDWYIRRNLQGYKVPIEFPETAVRLPPYFLGLWLGDGNARNGAIYTVEPEVREYLEDYAAECDCALSVEVDARNSRVQKCTVTNGRGGGRHRRGKEPGWILGEKGLLADWREVLAQGHAPSKKRIPQEYLVNASSVRLELLAGLLDSDGHLNKGGYTITQKDEALAKQIKFLADSLGFRTSIRSKTATIRARGFESTVWRVSINGEVDSIPVRVARKKALPRKINKDWRVTGFRVERDREDEFFGFVLDGDGLFLLEDMTVSHNTCYAENLAEHWAREGNRVVFLHFELNRSIMLDRRAVRATAIPRRILRMGKLTAGEQDDLARAKAAMLKWRGGITYVHTPGWTVEHALAEVRSLIVEGLCDVFVVDYLEKAASSQRQARQFGSQLFAREADDVEQIKTFAESAGIPALLLAQLNKAGKGQRFEDLDRTAIRGAGEKTEKANVVAMLYRESLDSQVVQVRIDKNTLGPPGSFKQYMRTERFLVTDIDEIAI